MWVSHQSRSCAAFLHGKSSLKTRPHTGYNCSCLLFWLHRETAHGGTPSSEKLSEQTLLASPPLSVDPL